MCGNEKGPCQRLRDDTARTGQGVVLVDRLESQETAFPF
jgi:hypothetical protein